MLVGEFQQACTPEAPVPRDLQGTRLPPQFHSETVSGCPLDPLARALADSESLEQLDRRCRSVFAVVAGGEGEVDLPGLSAGLRRLYLVPPVTRERGRGREGGRERETFITHICP